MEQKESKSNWVNRAYNKLTSPKAIKFCGYGVMIGYLGLLIIGVIIAATLDPDGYTVWDNWISDLGSIEHTPAPFLYDIACGIAGILSMPFIFYQERYIAPIPRTPEDLASVPHRMVYRGMSLAFFTTFLGNFFYIFVGIFSGDRNYFDLHMIFSELTFGFFMLGTLFFGFTLLISREIVPRPYNFIIGPIGIGAPLFMTVLNLIDSNPLREWGLLWSIMVFVIPVFLFTLRHAEKRLHSEN
ncbi:MAG: hypothetical protein HWN66_08840 [Candidatus Helarchaeota archaeon]|nr:hypothetical protein [Candidatus Helarchaeota archaeon]